METFPVAPESQYGYASRFSAAPSGHHGTDIFAPLGSRIVAVEAGTARRAEDPKGGHVVYLTAASGWVYYYAHLGRFSDRLTTDGVPVESGETIGAVGTSGNAAGKSPHLHFQARAPSGDLVDPFRWLVAVDPRHVERPILSSLGSSVALAFAVIWIWRKSHG